MSQDNIWEERYRYLEDTIEQICIGISKKPRLAETSVEQHQELEVKREGEGEDFLVCLVRHFDVIYEFNLISRGLLVYSQRGSRNAVELSKSIDRVIINVYEGKESLEPRFTKEVELDG